MLQKYCQNLGPIISIYIWFKIRLNVWIFYCNKSDSKYFSVEILDFWSCLPWISKLEWETLFALGIGIPDTHSLRFTSAVTPVNLLITHKVASPDTHMDEAQVRLLVSELNSYLSVINQVR